MKQIDLGAGKFAKVDSADFNFVASVKWCIICSNRNTKGELWYAVRKVRTNPGVKLYRTYKSQPMAVYIMGNAPDGYEWDHINGDSLDNRRSNLRLATRAQNCQNRMPSQVGKSSKYKGVQYNKQAQRFVAQIKFNGKRIRGGSYKNEEDAARKYNELALKYFGEFARLNLIPNVNEFLLDLR